MDTNPFLTADVPDSTDFPPDKQAPGLRKLDAALRCPVCGDLLDAPVTLPCGHCFCSTCARSALSIKQECPSCRKAANEGQLRPNPVMEEVISSWQQSRPHILLLIRKDDKKTKSPAAADKGTAKKRKLSERSSSLDNVVEEVAGPSRKPVGASKPAAGLKSPSKAKKAKAASNDEDIVEIVPAVSGANGAGDVADLNQLSNIVDCPLCSKKVRYDEINAHMDNNCRDHAETSKASSQWSKILGGAAKNGQQKGKHKSGKYESDDDEYPLPKASYDTLKDKQLKEMLSEQGLPTSGDRPILEQRHQRWVMIFNANLDRSLPKRKPKAELKRELRQWEQDMSKKKKIVIEDLGEYQRIHSSEFSRLIDSAKRTGVKAPAKSTDILLASSPASNLTLGDDSSPPQSSPIGSSNMIDLDSEDRR